MVHWFSHIRVVLKRAFTESLVAPMTLVVHFAGHPTRKIAKQKRYGTPMISLVVHCFTKQNHGEPLFLKKHISFFTNRPVNIRPHYSKSSTLKTIGWPCWYSTWNWLVYFRLNHQPVVLFPHIGGQLISVHLPLVQPNGMA